MVSSMEIHGFSPRIRTVSIEEGAKIAGNMPITVNFSKEMKAVDIEVSGATGTTTLDPEGWKATWTPSTAIPEGTHILTITGTDTEDQELEEFEPISFTALPPDTTPPDIDAAACEPKNGEIDIDPQKLTTIKIVFTEEMSEAKVDSFEPEDAKWMFGSHMII